MRPEQHHPDCDYRNSYAAVECDERHGVPDGEVANELHDCNLGCEPVAHTPGPWTIAESGGWVRDAGGRDLAFMEYLDDGVESVATRDANARLIAAAPDLLDAHRAVLARMDAWIGAPTPAERADIRSIMEAAIAKATGQEGER